VTQPPRDPQLLTVSPERFASHLDVLSHRARPIALSEMMARLAARRPLPPRAVALTFDDGYTDNARVAEPLLAKASIPATLFVATGYIESGKPYWWDAIETAVLGAPLPQRLELPFPDGPRVWEVVGEPHGSDGWSVLDSAEAGSRRAAYAEITAAVKPLDVPARDRVLDALRAASNSELAAQGDARPMTAETVAHMSRRGVIEIGAHTVHHPQLSVLNADEQEAEITGSVRAVERILGAAPATFAYPYGSSVDYDRISIGCVQRAGVRAACSNFPGTVGAETSPFELPRILIRNLAAEDFERALDAAFAAERIAS
jgi:peptidoglycan/xylan/chitin deacetylase (PgdA/CDA1 family)